MIWVMSIGYVTVFEAFLGYKKAVSRYTKLKNL